MLCEITDIIQVLRIYIWSQHWLKVVKKGINGELINSLNCI